MVDALNVTSSSWDTVVGPGSWGGTVIYLFLFILLPIGLITIGLAVLWNLASYTRFKKYLNWLGSTFQYAMIGLGSVGVLAIPVGFLYWGYTQAKQGNIVPFKYVGYIILAYAALSAIGWVVSKFVIERVQKFEKQLNKNKTKIKNEQTTRNY